mgnify:CR=1 FL=1
MLSVASNCPSGTKLPENSAEASLEERYNAQCKLLLSEKPIFALR